MFLEALFSHLRKRFSEFLYKILAIVVYMRSLAYKLSQCNPELRCVICTGVTLFALVLHLNCTALSQSESSNFFMCIIMRVTGIVRIVSSIAPFFNCRLCFEKYSVSLFISGQSLPKPNSPVSPNPRFSMSKSSLFPGSLTLFSVVVLIKIG